MLLWGALVVSTIDNIIRPLIISRGSDLPFVLVLLGVLGGVVAFGFIGVFLGPVLLALGYALLNEWATHEPAPDEDAVERETRRMTPADRRQRADETARGSARGGGRSARARARARKGDSACTICEKIFGFAAMTCPPCR